MKCANYAVAILLLLLPMLAHASCFIISGNAPTVSISFAASTITIDPNAAVGTVLATSGLVTPPGNSQIACLSTTNTGIVTAGGAQFGSNLTVFPTNVSGVGIRILHPDSSTPLNAYPFERVTADTYNLSVQSAYQLVKTGPIANGATVNGGALYEWLFDNNVIGERFNLGQSVTLVYPTCSVNNSVINVVLPTISTTAFNGVGTTAGATPIDISLNCQAGKKLFIEFDTSTPSSVDDSVIANATGNGRAKNVGVQLINSSFKAVSFGDVNQVGVTPNGALDLTYYARYYQTANNPTAGSVSTTATFTLTYQ